MSVRIHGVRIHYDPVTDEWRVESGEYPSLAYGYGHTLEEAAADYRAEMQKRDKRERGSR